MYLHIFVCVGFLLGFGVAEAQSALSLQLLPAFGTDTQRYTSIVADDEGNVALLDSTTASISKFFAGTAYDSAISVGGKSGRATGFLHPIALAFPNRQSLFVLDDGLRRVSMLNTDLKSVQDLQCSSLLVDGNDMLPSAFGVSAQGEMYLLNSLDNKVYRLDIQGNIASVFGGLDYGEGSLAAPAQLHIGIDNNVYISDTAAQSISIFDRFGIFRYQWQPNTPFRWQKFVLINHNLLLFNEHYLYIENTLSHAHQWHRLPEGLRLRALASDGRQLFLLTQSGIFSH